MSRLRHQNVCLYMGICLEPPCLLMEYCARRSVDALLSQGLKDQRVSCRAAEIATVPCTCCMLRVVLPAGQRRHPAGPAGPGPPLQPI
jgi:hypothetical protein